MSQTTPRLDDVDELDDEPPGTDDLEPGPTENRHTPRPGEGDTSSGGISLPTPNLSRTQMAILAVVVVLLVLAYMRHRQTLPDREDEGSRELDEADTETDREPVEIRIPDGEQNEREAAVLDALKDSGRLSAGSGEAD